MAPFMMRDLKLKLQRSQGRSSLLPSVSLAYALENSSYDRDEFLQRLVISEGELLVPVPKGARIVFRKSNAHANHEVELLLPDYVRLKGESLKLLFHDPSKALMNLGGVADCSSDPESVDLRGVEETVGRNHLDFDPLHPPLHMRGGPDSRLLLELDEGWEWLQDPVRIQVLLEDVQNMGLDLTPATGNGTQTYYPGPWTTPLIQDLIYKWIAYRVGYLSANDVKNIANELREQWEWRGYAVRKTVAEQAAREIIGNVNQDIGRYEISDVVMSRLPEGLPKRLQLIEEIAARRQRVLTSSRYEGYGDLTTIKHTLINFGLRNERYSRLVDFAINAGRQE